MDDGQIFDKILSMSGDKSLMLFALYVGWQIKTHLKHLEVSLETIRDSVAELANVVNRLNVSQDNGKLEIERIRDDIKTIFKRLDNAKP